MNAHELGAMLDVLHEFVRTLTPDEHAAVAQGHAVYAAARVHERTGASLRHSMRLVYAYCALRELHAMQESSQP